MVSPLRTTLAVFLLLGTVTFAVGGAAQPPEACTPAQVNSTPSDPVLAELQRGNALLAADQAEAAVAAYEEARQAALIRADVRLATQAAANRSHAQIAAGDIDGVALELDRLAAVAQGLEPLENARMLIHLGRSGAQLGIDQQRLQSAHHPHPVDRPHSLDHARIKPFGPQGVFLLGPFELHFVDVGQRRKKPVDFLLVGRDRQRPQVALLEQ